MANATGDVKSRPSVEAQTKQAEDELRAIVDNAPVFLWSDLPDGYCDFLNQPWLDYFNLSLEVAQGTGWATLLHPDDAAHHLESWQKSIAAGIPFETETRFRRPDGEYRWFLTRANPLRDKTGRIVKWYGTNIDIENLKRTETRLRRSEANLAEAQRLSRTGSWAVSPATTKIFYWSEECYRIWGFDPVHGLPSRETVWRRIHPDDRERVLEEAEHALREKRDYSSEFRIVLPDGTVKYLEATNHHLFSADGELVQVVGTNVDVTERKRAEQALREREAKIRRLVEANIIGIFIWDFEGRILEANEAFLRIVGYDHEDLVAGRIRWTDLTPPEWRDRDTRLIQEQRLTGALPPFEKEYFRKDGSRVPVLIGVATFEKGGNQGVAFVLDLTERKRGEERLRRSEAYLAEAQRLSHTGSAAYNETEILYWSEEASRIWGFDPLQGIPSREAVWQRIHPDDLDRVNENIAHGLREKRSFANEFRIILPDGTIKHIEAVNYPVFSASGELLEIVVTGIDVTERKRAEQTLQRSQFYLSEGQRIARIGSWAFNPSGFFDHWSQELFQIYGLDPQKGAPTLEQYLATIHPLDRDSMAETIRRMHAERCGCDVKKRIVLPDGELRYIRCVGIPVIEDEVLKGFLGTAMDITEQELLTQELRASEGRFRDYAETASDWFWEIGPDYKFTLLTENAFGSHAADRIGTACWDHALDLETEPEKWRLVQAALDARKPFRDFVYCTAGGNGPMHVKASGKPVFDANGEFRGYRGTGSDVTAIIRAQEALRESERSARSAFDGIAGLVSILAPNGEVEAANRQFLEYFGSLEWVKNWETNDAVHPEDLPRVAELFKRAIASGIPFQHELRLRRFDGEYRWFENRGVPIRDDSGRIVRWYVLLTDIEDRKRALARLEQMQSDFAHMNRVSMMGELAASLSHEITQPIASARNNARAALNFLDKSLPDLGEVREALSSIVDDTDRAGDIVDRIRDNIKKAPPRKDYFDVNAAINEVIVLARSAINKNGVSVQARLAEGLFPVQGDRVQLQQVILNLLLNACEAMGSSDAGTRNLSISTEQDHTGFLVAVRDSGPGIDPAHLKRIFDAFYTTKSSGVGMGLSICRSIIAAHGGRLWAEANEPRGAVFQFTLPGAQVGS
jgi:PAS domain S-box-containing protein